MDCRTVFKRYELKYMLSKDEARELVGAIEPYMKLDKYGKTTIRNVYFDNDSYRLIRRSIEKPTYKEKLRVRSYAEATRESNIFVELKKKYEGVVYKRRVLMSEGEAMDWICAGGRCPCDTQISREIDYFKSYFGPLKPTVFLSYDREAYYMRDGSDFRITFDTDLLARAEELSLTCTVHGEPLMDSDSVLMELKCMGGMPLWMAHILSRMKIYKTSFSKYGAAYKSIILSNICKQSLACSKEELIYGTII